jgi:hypothetical protein
LDSVWNQRLVSVRHLIRARAYSIDRVKRSCDEKTVQAVLSSEMSPNKALVQAGIRENRQVYIPRDPAKAAEKLRGHFGDEWVGKLSEAFLK